MNRAYFICHMMQTLDGKVASGIEGIEIIMDYFDTYTETEKQLDAKVWMFGRKTASAFSQKNSEPLIKSNSVRNLDDYQANNDSDHFAVIIDTKGVLRWNNNFINLSEQENKFYLIIIVTSKTPIEYITYLKNKNISYIICGDEINADLIIAAEKLKKIFNIEKVLLEGGGTFNGSMMSSDLIDEISLLLLPRVLNNAQAPALFNDNNSKIKTHDYILKNEPKILKDVVWLQYIKNK